MKKILTLIIALFTCFGAYAQFEKGKKYIGASLSSLDISHNDINELNAKFSLNAGYFVNKDFMLRGTVGYGYENKNHEVKLGLNARYYFDRNGIFIGTGGECSWRNNVGWRKHGKWLLNVPVELGYAFFINRHVTIEPALNYNFCLNEYKYYSGIGFKVGFGVYF